MKKLCATLSLIIAATGSPLTAQTLNQSAMQLFKMVMQSERSEVETLLADCAATDINARWAVANDVTPIEIALNKAIRAAKKYNDVVAGTQTSKKISTGLIVGGGLALATTGLLSSHVLDVLKSDYVGYGVSLGIIAAAIGWVLNPSGKIDNTYASLYNKVAIAQTLLNTKALDLSTTKLDLESQETQDGLQKLRTIELCPEQLQQFVADVQAGTYDNLIFTGKA